MPSFDPPPNPGLANLGLAALTARVAALEARLALIESAVAVGADGSVTIAANGRLNLTSTVTIDLSVAQTTMKFNQTGVSVSANLADFTCSAARFNCATIDLNAAVINAQGIVKSDTLIANTAIVGGRPI